MRTIYILILAFIFAFSFSVKKTIAQGTKYEAENATLTGTSVLGSRTGFSGTGYVGGFDAASDKVTFNFDMAAAGQYDLYISVALPNGNKSCGLVINSVVQNDVTMTKPDGSANFFEIKVGTIVLKAGSNSIAITEGWGWYELDYIRITQPAALTPWNLDAVPVSPNSSSEAVKLWNYLKDNFGKKILSGQQGGTTELNRINSLSGKKPAVRGFDMIEYSPTRVAFGSLSTETQLATDWWKAGGIVTFSWHWNAPKDLLNTADQPWWKGFYTTGTTFDPTIAMNNSETDEYKLIIRDIDAIAVQLKVLKDNNVPVLWRPLHEASGGWFWWGAKGPAVCKWLYRLMFQRLTNYHNLNNLIWVWTSYDDATALDWYPGDDVVDVVGADIYLADGNYNASYTMFNNLRTIFKGKKLVTMSENGPMPDPDNLVAENAGWSWFCTWAGDFITDGVKNSTSIVQKSFTHSYVITLDELPDLKNYTDVEVKSTSFIPEIYPNPVVNKLTIRAGDIEQFEVLDISGRKLLAQNVLKGMESLVIDVSTFKPGIYFIRSFSGNEMKTWKFIKTNE
jgi:mannan endo-1,4-beta-mannosidase